MSIMSTLAAVIAIRWAAASQALPVVVIHGVWMLLAAHTWTEAYPNDHVAGVVVDKAMVFYVWLGGMGPDGHHGDADSLLAAWFKLSLPLYLLAELWRWKRGPRPSTRWWLIVFWSAAIALAGYSFALWPALPTVGNAQDAPWFLTMMTIAASLATAWAVVSRRLGERLIVLIGSGRHVTALKAPKN